MANCNCVHCNITTRHVSINCLLLFYMFSTSYTGNDKKVKLCFVWLLPSVLFRRTQACGVEMNPCHTYAWGGRHAVVCLSCVTDSEKYLVCTKQKTVEIAVSLCNLYSLRCCINGEFNSFSYKLLAPNHAFTLILHWRAKLYTSSLDQRWLGLENTKSGFMYLNSICQTHHTSMTPPVYWPLTATAGISTWWSLPVQKSACIPL